MDIGFGTLVWLFMMFLLRSSLSSVNTPWPVSDILLIYLIYLYIYTALFYLSLIG